MVGTAARFRTMSANGVCHMRPYTGRCVATVCPLEMSRISAPAVAKAFAMAITSASLKPPSAQSQADIRTLNGLAAGQAARTARSTCSGNASDSQPAAVFVLLTLVSGDRKLASK